VKPIVRLHASAALSKDHGTRVTISILVTDEGGRTCVSRKTVEMPMRPDHERPYEWAQEALCALIDGLDCLCDIELQHDADCPEVPRVEA